MFSVPRYLNKCLQQPKFSGLTSDNLFALRAQGLALKCVTAGRNRRFFKYHAMPTKVIHISAHLEVTDAAGLEEVVQWNDVTSYPAVFDGVQI
ncbi:unnamed protein product [Echinostoma caproni]|uniref:5'-nucleotidase n=1 Tax=Echinostoma caproni TaxID=27848 RepID=A0A183B389_9TREM|nr:unnamed protein product [Echinostoma caproni]